MGAGRWRDPDEDLPKDFEAHRRAEHYTGLRKPLDPAEFSGSLREEMTAPDDERGLSEFLVKKPDPHHPAIHRDDYASDFNLGSVDSALYRRLNTDFDYASQHVAHFSLSRLPTEESAGVEYVGAARLRAHAEDVFGAMRAYIRHMHATESGYADDFERWLSTAEARRPEALRPG